MYSLNIPVPGSINQRGMALAPALVSFERTRDRYTLVCKRFPDTTPADLHHLDTEIREELRGQQPFRVTVTGLDVFTNPPAGPGPVLYFVVNSHELQSLHVRLCDAFSTVPEIEGTNYIPHITIARGGDSVPVEQLVSQQFSPIEWTVTELWLWDAKYSDRVSSISLPC